jgi:hypothetical protein
LYQRRVSVLEDVNAYYDDMKLIREEGGRNFDPVTHEMVIAQEQEDWVDYYHKFILPLIK